MTYEEASSKVLAGKKGMLIMGGYEAPSRFVFTLQPMKGEPLCDSIYSVDKASGKVAEYPVFNNLKEWQQISANPIYLRKKK